MKGWNGYVLRIDLARKKHAVEPLDASIALNYLGGRGLAVKVLWDELKPGVDPLSPANKLVLATGPLTGLPLPSSGKMVIASKSPLTNGYGDGNIGTRAAVHLRKAGYDLVIFEGASDKPVYVYIENGRVEFRDASEYWGLATHETEKKLLEEHGKDVGVLCIGPAGENLVRYATVISQEGRSAGRPGMGAVMGSKKLKAIVLKGTKEIELAKPEELKEAAQQAYAQLTKSTMYEFWLRQGTMMTIAWSQENSVLPTNNFSEGLFDYADKISGDVMEKMEVKRRGCPYCNMICGHVVKCQLGESELDYENVAMLGSNIGIGDLDKVSCLNLKADLYGVDTISLGNAIGFYMEATEKGAVPKDEGLEWGDFQGAMQLVDDIAYRRGKGDLLAEGVRRASEKLGNDSYKYAMHVKGLEVSAYDCHAAPGMALAYATSSIGAHHKDAWVISWEVKVGRLEYTKDKVMKVIEFQRVRGGIFESLTTCRLPWIELGLEVEWYVKFLNAATGQSYTIDDLYAVADRIYALIRSFWIREYGGWSREYDYPPPKWFEQPLQKGPYKGTTLDREKFDAMLSWYYKERGWNEQGVPTKETLEKLGLGDVAATLSQYASL